MSAADVVVLVAAAVACLAAVASVAAAAVLVTQVRRLEAALRMLRDDAVPLVSEARRAAGAAADELERVGAVLEDAGSVTATVESATRLAQRAFANPVVKVLALRAGAASGLRQLRQPARPAPRRRAR
jgi:hypothetical protein